MPDAGGPLGAVVVLDEVGSTNDEVMALARAGAPHGFALRARSQTAGRGRRDHVWSSPEGGLYLSVLLRPAVPDALLSGVSVACALGAARALTASGARGLRLKWPNDLVVGGRKLGGVLVEVARPEGGPIVVCGLGVNLRVPDVIREGPASLPPTGLASCLAEGACPPDVDELAERVRAEVLAEAGAWEAALAAAGPGAEPLTGLLDSYQETLALRGERVEVRSADGAAVGEGVLLGVDGWGRALVERPDGTRARLDAARFSVRPAS